jgi:hypothetical protein
MSIDFASMIQSDMAAGPGTDFGRTLTFEKSNKRGRAEFTVSGVPVSGIPYEETGRIDADFEAWTCTAHVSQAVCPYQPDIGGLVTISGTVPIRCRIKRVTPDPLGGFYALELEPKTRG